MPEFKTEFATAIEPVEPTAAGQTAAELKAAQEEEWGQFVAATRIHSPSGALAFLPGHAVPASSVSDQGPVFPGQVMPRDRTVERELATRAAAAPASAAAGQVAQPDARPAGNATAEEWRAYAVAQGMTQEEAAGLGRDELREQYAAV